MPAMTESIPEFGFTTDEPRHTAAYLRPAVMTLMPQLPAGSRMLDIGCGNGYWSVQFLKQGVSMVGIAPSAEGIAIARRAHPRGRFEQTVVSDDLLQRLGEAPFDVIISTEVVEHLYDPKSW